MKQNKTFFFAFICFAMLLSGCDTSRNVEPVFNEHFIKYYGNEGDQSGADLLVNPDGSMFLLGNSVLPSGVANSFLIKVDHKGNVLWERQIGADNEIAVDVELVMSGPDRGGVVVVSNNVSGGSSKIRLSKVSQSGDIILSSLINEGLTRPFSQMAKSVTSLEQLEGYIVTGISDGGLVKESTPIIAESSEEEDILAFQLNDALAVVDTIVTKGGELAGAGIKVFELNENPLGNFVLFGYSNRPNLSPEFQYNFTFDLLASGIPIGSLVGSEDEDEILSTVIRTESNVGQGYLMAGTAKQQSGSIGIYLVKLNTALEKNFSRKLDLARNVDCVSAANAPFGYYLLGNEYDADGTRDIALLKVSAVGNELGGRNFGTRDADDYAAAVAALPDGRIAILGTMQLQTKKKMALIILNGSAGF